MKPLILGLCALALAAAPALAQGTRNPANVERDADRHPEQVVAFADLEPGATVLDWGAGGGYWSEVFAEAVGANGTVYAQGTREPIEGWDNIDPLPMERGDPIPLEDASVDLIILSYVYHHMYFNEASGEATPPATQTQLAEYARVLKPGGRVLVIEHQALEGSTRAEANPWHRAPKAAVIEDFAGAGFTLASENPDIFNNPDDTQQGNWQEEDLRGHTTGMAILFQKP